MRNYFTLDGTDSRDFGVYISGQGTFNGPAREVPYISVPGRDGDLIGLSTRLQNGTLTYPAFIYKDFDTNLANFRSFLAGTTGYRELIDSYHTDEYRMVAYDSSLSVSPTSRNNAGQFNITFTCKPQRFLTSGQTAISITASSTTITNPTLFASKPLIYVYVSRTAASVLGVGDTNITFKGRSGWFYVDCESGRAYYNGTALDSYVTLNQIDYPTLEPGANGITKGTGISTLRITPRWWRV